MAPLRIIDSFMGAATLSCMNGHHFRVTLDAEPEPLAPPQSLRAMCAYCSAVVNGSELVRRGRLVYHWPCWRLVAPAACRKRCAICKRMVIMPRRSALYCGACRLEVRRKQSSARSRRRKREAREARGRR